SSDVCSSDLPPPPRSSAAARCSWDQCSLPSGTAPLKLKAVKKSAHGKLKHAPPLQANELQVVGHALACQRPNPLGRERSSERLSASSRRPRNSRPAGSPAPRTSPDTSDCPPTPRSPRHRY